jgi:hypothetical protein
MTTELDNLTPGARLRKLRESRGLTQVQLGKAVNMHPVMISYFETEQREIGAPSVLKFARYFGVDCFLFVKSPEKILAAT